MTRFTTLFRNRRWSSAAAAALLALVAIASTSTVSATGRRAVWVGTWSASPQPAGAPVQFNGQTVRQIVHTSLGGRLVRVRLSNAYGQSPLAIGAAHIALSQGGSVIVSGTDRALTFHGAAAIVVPTGALVLSDPVQLEVPALGDLAVSLYLPENVVAATEHTAGLQTTYLSGPGNFTDAAAMGGSTTQSYYFLAGVEVRRADGAGAVVTIGDSVTDGFSSTPDSNHRWPNLLAERLQTTPGTARLGVLNAGVIGNRVLHDLVGTSGLARLDRDVLVQPAARYLIVLQGNADILIPGLVGNPAEEVTADQIIQGHRQIIDRAHAQGLRVFGGTLNPVAGYPFPGYWSAALEAKRQAVNRWIRTSRAYDAVIDFDRVLRDPTQPARLLPAYDSGDHVHPNDVGYQAMADAIDLSLFRDDD